MRRMLWMMLGVLVVGMAAGSDWPQLMGPNRDNTTSEVVSPWEESPRVRWRRHVGEGKTPPVVVRGKLYLQSKVKDKEIEQLLCLDAATGEELWAGSYPRATYESNNGNGPRGAPAMVAGRVYTHGLTGVLTCWDADTGKQYWQVDTHKELKVPVLKYGVFCSPLVIGNRVLVNVGAPGASVAGFDTDTGKLAWKSLDDGVATSSPILYQAKDDVLPHAVFMTDRRLVGIDPLDGAILWEHRLAEMPFTSGPPPVWIEDMVFASSIAFGGVGIRVTRGPSGYTVEELWKNPDLASYYPTVIPADRDHFWVTVNGSDQGASVVCVNRRTGKEVWRTDELAEWHVGLLRTGDGKVLLYDGKARLRLMEHTLKGPRELCRVKVGIGNTINQALADGLYYVRDHSEIVCLELVKK